MEEIENLRNDFTFERFLEIEDFDSKRNYRSGKLSADKENPFLKMLSLFQNTFLKISPTNRRYELSKRNIDKI